MVSEISYSFDLSSDKKFIKFRGECGEEYVLTHELSWTIYGNSILSIGIECSIEKNILFVAELYSASNNSATSSAILEDGKASLYFQNVNFLTDEPWKCVLRMVPHFQLRDCQESTISSCSSEIIKKGPVQKVKLEQLSKDMQTILNSGDLSDVVLSNGTIKIPAHKVILAARSPVFAKMFQHPMKENQENFVMISDIPDDVLKELVSFMYTGTVTIKDSKLARNLYITADKYSVMGLKKLCSEVLQKMTPDNVLDMLAMADLLEDATLKQAALDFIAMNYSQLKKSKDWEDFMNENKTLAIEILSFVIDSKI